MRRTQEKKLIWEHQTLSLLLFPFSSSQGCAQSGHSDQQSEKNEIHQVQMPKEGTPGALPLFCNKGQASAQKFPHKSINLLLKMNLALRQCPSSGLWNPCCTNSCTTSLFYVLGFATVPYLHLYGRTYEFFNCSLQEHFYGHIWCWLAISWFATSGVPQV